MKKIKRETILLISLIIIVLLVTTLICVKFMKKDNNNNEINLIDDLERLNFSNLVVENVEGMTKISLDVENKSDVATNELSIWVNLNNKDGIGIALVNTNLRAIQPLEKTTIESYLGYTIDGITDFKITKRNIEN